MIIKARARRTVVFTDADNTLWDTDAVYADAQLSLLSDLESAYGGSIVEIDRLAFVRKADQGIALSHELGLRYPPRLLVEALLQGVELDDRLLGEIEEAFIARLSNSVPNLRPGVSDGLERLSSAGVPITIVTEGGEQRCRDLLIEHEIDQLIADVISSKKTSALFFQLADIDQMQYFVGDQLDVDIAFARAAGFDTIYFPGNFTPHWTSRVQDVSKYQIASFAEVPQIVLAM